MSLAIPASYNEYYYTTPNPELICDGGIMPLRNGAADSTWYRNCLRAEDLIFLNEANNIRGKCCRYSLSPPNPTKYIDSSKLGGIRDHIGYIWQYGGRYAPSLQAHVFDADTLLDSNGKTVDEYIQSCFANKTRYSGNDTYYRNPLRADQIMNFFKDIKQLNYFYVNGGTRGSAVPYRQQRGCTTERTYTPSQDPMTFTHDGYVWYDSLFQHTSDNQVTDAWEEHVQSNYFTFTIYSSGDQIAKTLIDLSIWVGCYVYNYAGKMNAYSEYGDTTNITKYVLVPLKTPYTDMTNISVPTVSSSELSTMINLAFSTAGLQKSANAIPCGEPPASIWDTVYYDATSNLQPWDVYYFTHVKYCTLENVAVS